MNTREVAYNIFQQLNEEQLQGFISMYEKLFILNNSSQNKADKIEAFEKLNSMIRTVPNLDDELELSEYRAKRYGY